MLLTSVMLIVCLSASLNFVNMISRPGSAQLTASSYSVAIGRRIPFSHRAYLKDVSQIRQMARRMSIPVTRRNSVNVHSLFGGSKSTRFARQTSFLGCGTKFDYITYGRIQYIWGEDNQLYSLCYCSRYNCGQELFQPILVVSCQSTHCCAGGGSCFLISRPVTLCVHAVFSGRQMLKEFNLPAACQCGNLY